MTTGTRTQVALTRISASPRILRVSLISLRSSSVWSSPAGKLPAWGSDVEGDRVRDRPRGSASWPSSTARDCVAQLVDRRLAGAGDGLVGGDHQPLDPGLVEQRLQRDDHLHRRAVGVGDDPVVAVERVGVDLGDDQRHVVVHAPVAGVVDDHGAGLDQARRPLGADRTAGRGEDDVEALDRVLARARGSRASCRSTRARLPAERSEAKGTTSEAGKSRSASSSRIVVPTSPVAPTTPTLYPSPAIARV